MDNTIEDSNQYKCPMCEEIFNNDIVLMDHFMIVHCENLMNDISIDHHSYDDYENNNINDLNESDGYESDEYDPDDYYERVYKESVYGEYVCRICSRKFISDERLNEHFMHSHTSYDDTLQLDKSEADGGFPGFNILQHMNVFNYIDNPETETCPICLDNYVIDDKLKEKLKFDEDTYIEDDDSNEAYPIKLTCCNQHMCSKCLKTYIMSNNKVLCPFCKFNHELSSTDFLVIPKTKCNVKSWEEWRKKHPLNVKT